MKDFTYPHLHATNERKLQLWLTAFKHSEASYG